MTTQEQVIFIVLILVSFVVYDKYNKEYNKKHFVKKETKENYNLYVANQARQNQCTIL